MTVFGPSPLIATLIPLCFTVRIRSSAVQVKADPRFRVLFLAFLPLLPTAKPGELASALSGLALLKHTPDKAWLAAFEARAIQALPNAVGAELSGLLWAYGKMRQAPGAALLAVAEARLDALLDGAPESPRVPTSCRASPSPPLSPPRAPRLRSTHTHNPLRQITKRTAVAASPYPSPPSSTHAEGAVAPQNLAGVFWAFARLGRPPPPATLERMLAAAETLFPYCGPQDLARPPALPLPLPPPLVLALALRPALAQFLGAEAVSFAEL